MRSIGAWRLKSAGSGAGRFFIYDCINPIAGRSEFSVSDLFVYVCLHVARVCEKLFRWLREV